MKVSSLRIDAVVVLYEPADEALAAVSSIAKQVAAVYVVDNSEPPAEQVAATLSRFPNLTYLHQGENLGVATALNIGAERALSAGSDFLITMDQDSVAAPGMVERMTACLARYDSETVGMIAPFHLTKGASPADSAVEFEEVMTPMTSGCLLNLSVYGKVGAYRDDLFIDFVDNEYCLRLKKAGFRVIRANRAVLRHSVGDTRRFGPFIATNHSPLRRYYKTRNRFMVNRLYRCDFPGHCLLDWVRLTKEMASILLFEREKAAKIRMMWRGYLDYRRGRFGRLVEGGHP